MPPKRRSAPTLQDVPAKRATATAPQSENSGVALISKIPVDILTLIFTYFPRRVRLQALSLVCKSWRTAILRSVTSVSISAESGADVLAAVALFPSVTELDLSYYRGEEPIPELGQLVVPGLRSVKMDFPTEEGLWNWASEQKDEKEEDDKEEEGSSDRDEGDKPKDGEENIGGTNVKMNYPALVILINEFLAKQAPQLESLTLSVHGDGGSVEPAGPMISKLRFPKLQSLELYGCWHIVWKWPEAVPSLTNITMRSWRPGLNEGVDQFLQLQNLRQIFYDVDEYYDFSADAMAYLARSAVMVALRAQPSKKKVVPEPMVYEAVCLSPHDPIPQGHLSRLHTVTLCEDSRNRAWKWEDAIALLQEFMERSASIKKVKLTVASAPKDNGDSLIALALQYGLSQIDIEHRSKNWAFRDMENLIKYGWLKIRVG